MFAELNIEVNGLWVVFPSAHAGFEIKKVRVMPNRIEQKTNLNLKEFPVSIIRSMSTMILFFKVGRASCVS
jgi:hypothetical protein